MPKKPRITHLSLHITHNTSPISSFGFTLIELMVAISIVAIVATIGAIVYSQAQNSGKITKRRQDLIAINQALELYRNSTGKYPISTGFDCVASLSGVNSLAPTYMPIVPTDPAGISKTDPAACYLYKSDGTEYKVRTNPQLYTNAEMTTDDFKQQPSLIDPWLDATSNCDIETNGDVQAWALYTTGACGW